MGLVGFTTASCLSSSCTYWNVCFILSSTSLSLSPCRFCWRICWVFTKSACFFRSSRRPIVILSLRTPISIHHFASRRLRGLGPALPDWMGDCKKSRNRKRLCAFPRVDTQLIELARGDQARQVVSQSLSAHRERLRTPLEKPRLIQGIELRQRARHEPHDGGMHLGRRPERTGGDREQPLEAEAVLQHDRQPPVLGVSRIRDHTLDYLVLQHVMQIPAAGYSIGKLV